MHLSACVFILSTIFTSVTLVTPHYNHEAFEDVLSKRQGSGDLGNNGLVVDLGYERYQGVFNSSTGLNNWFGYEVQLVGLCASHH